MSAEIQYVTEATAQTPYATVRNRAGQLWNNLTSAFQTIDAAAVTNYTARYPIVLTEVASSGFYYGTMPTTILPGWYYITIREGNLITCSLLPVGAPRELLMYWDGTYLSPAGIGGGGVVEH